MLCKPTCNDRVCHRGDEKDDDGDFRVHDAAAAAPPFSMFSACKTNRLVSYRVSCVRQYRYANFVRIVFRLALNFS